MFSSPTLSHFSSIILLHVTSYYQGSTIMMMMSMWYVILAPFFMLMVVVGSSRRNNHDSDKEIEVDNTDQGDEEGMEGDEDNENDSDEHDPQKSKEKYTPLWKYVTRLGGGKGGGTTKFTCHHCHTKYIGSYTHVRKHMCGTMY
jgi:ABC-type nickel/cobalt efflux system permease component RcnA